MKSRYHIIMSLGISLALFLIVKDSFAALTCFIFGVFVDIDHLVDYWMITGKLTRNITELLEKIGPNELVYIPLHSWELMLSLMILTPVYKPIFGATIGYMFHIFSDLIFNHATIEGFLFMYRISVGWRKELVFANYNPNQEQ